VTTPNLVMGRQVTIEGYVAKVFNNRAFVLRGVGDLKSARVPIITSQPIPGQNRRSDANPVRVGDQVQVTGKVTRFTVEEMQKTTGARYVERDYRIFESKPMLIANLVVVQPGARTSGSRLYRRQVTSPNGVQSAPSVSQQTFATPADLLAVSDLKSLIGKFVKINTANVLSVISDRGFYVGDSAGRRLFAVLDRSLDKGVMEHIVVVKKGQKLALGGTIESMPAETGALRRWTVDPKEAAQLAKQPVYLHVRDIHFK
jgi:hypothetical protein